jgi:chromosome segregation ATPase
MAMHDGQDCSLRNPECVLAAEVRALREKYPEPPTGIPARSAARQRFALGGADAQALEGALQQVERELSETKAHLRSALDAGEAAERRVVELREEHEKDRKHFATLQQDNAYARSKLKESERDLIEARQANELYCEDQNAKAEEIDRMQESIDMYRETIDRLKRACRCAPDEALKRSDPFGGME